MTILKKLEGRLYRKVPVEHKHMTVYGYHELTKFTCAICKKEGYLSEAYLESKSKRKHESDVRPYHASCYNATNGRISRKEDIEATLEFFIMEQS